MSKVSCRLVRVGPGPATPLPRTEAFRVYGVFSSFVPARLASWECCPVTDGGRRLREVRCLDLSQLASGEEGGSLVSWRSVCCHPTQLLAQRGTAFHRVRGDWRTGVNKSGFLPNEAGAGEGPAAQDASGPGLLLCSPECPQCVRSSLRSQRGCSP